MNFVIPEVEMERLGWTLIHFVWEGLAIAIALAVVFRGLRNGPPNRRYLAGCVALLCMALAPVITFQLLSQRFARPPAAIAFEVPPLAPVTVTSPASPADTMERNILFTPRAMTIHHSRRLETCLPWLVIAWLAGVLGLSCRLAAGWLQIQRLRRTANAIIEGEWAARLAFLCDRIGIRRSVRLLHSTCVGVPMVIGWLRPVIILPASCLTALTPTQWESILAHELAHVRRHDYLVNLLQSVLETLLFYHPAVWWVSRQVRMERENCCDDLAVGICGNRLEYARALATLEELRPAFAPFAVAAGGAPLLNRIRRLAGKPEVNAPRASDWVHAGVIVSILIALLATDFRASHALRAERKPGSEYPTRTNLDLPFTNITAVVQPTAASDPGSVADMSAKSGSANTHAMESRVYHFTDSAFGDELERWAAINPGAVQPSGFSINNGTPPAHSIVHGYFAAAGIELDTGNPANIGKSFIYVPAAHTLIIHAPPTDLDLATKVLAGDNISFSWTAQDLDGAAPISATSPTNTLETRVFQLGSNAVPYALYSRKQRQKASTLSPREAAALWEKKLQQYFAVFGVDIGPGSPFRSRFIYDSRAGQLVALAPEAELEVIDEALEDLRKLALQNGAGPRPGYDLNIQSIEIDGDIGGNSGLDWLFADSGIRYRTNISFVSATGPLSSALTSATGALVAGVLTPAQYRQVMSRLKNQPGAGALEEKEFTTESGRSVNAWIATSNPMIEDTNGDSIPVIPMARVTPTIAENGHEVDLAIATSVTEFMGKKSLATGTNATTSGGVSVAVLPLPHLRFRERNLDATIESGGTLILADLSTNILNSVLRHVPLPPTASSSGPVFRRVTAVPDTHSVLVFMTVTRINQDGSPDK